MRLLTFSINGDAPSRVGLAVTVSGGDYVIDARHTYAAYLRAAMNPALAHRLARALVPNDMRTVLEAGADSNRALRAAETYAHEQVSTLHDVTTWNRLGLLFAADEITFHPPIPRPGKILAVGSNYPVDGGSSSASNEVPREELPVRAPLIFSKAPSSLAGHRTAIPITSSAADIDCEAELAIVIGRRVHNITAAEAPAAIAGYVILNDLTRRDAVADEKARGAICFAKNFPGSAPCGPYIVTPDEFDPASATIDTWVGQDHIQHGDISDMITSIGELIALCSAAGLEPGDIISTGSPKPAPGTPPRYVGAGDTITIRVAGIGELHSPLVSASPSGGEDRATGVTPQPSNL